MTLEDLRRTCLKRSGCENCPAEKECKKWQKLMKECTEPWEMGRVKEAFEQATVDTKKHNFVELSDDVYNFLWVQMQRVEDSCGKKVSEEDMIYESLYLMEDKLLREDYKWNH